VRRGQGCPGRGAAGSRRFPEPLSPATAPAGSRGRRRENASRSWEQRGEAEVGKRGIHECCPAVPAISGTDRRVTTDR